MDSDSDTAGLAEWRIEQVVGNLLRIGVMLAAAVVLIGGIFYLIRFGPQAPNYRVFAGEPQQLRSVGGILADALDRRSRGLILLGLLILIATPAARVAYMLYVFVREKDRLYVGISLIVLSFLVIG